MPREQTLDEILAGAKQFLGQRSVTDEARDFATSEAAVRRAAQRLTPAGRVKAYGAPVVEGLRAAALPASFLTGPVGMAAGGALALEGLQAAAKDPSAMNMGMAGLGMLPYARAARGAWRGASAAADVAPDILHGADMFSDVVGRGGRGPVATAGASRVPYVAQVTHPASEAQHGADMFNDVISRGGQGPVSAAGASRVPYVAQHTPNPHPETLQGAGMYADVLSRRVTPVEESVQGLQATLPPRVVRQPYTMPEPLAPSGPRPNAGGRLTKGGTPRPGTPIQESILEGLRAAGADSPLPGGSLPPNVRAYDPAPEVERLKQILRNQDRRLQDRRVLGGPGDVPANPEAQALEALRVTAGRAPTGDWRSTPPPADLVAKARLIPAHAQKTQVDLANEIIKEGYPGWDPHVRVKTIKAPLYPEGGAKGSNRKAMRQREKIAGMRD